MKASTKRVYLTERPLMVQVRDSQLTILTRKLFACKMGLNGMLISRSFTSLQDPSNARHVNLALFPLLSKIPPRHPHSNTPRLAIGPLLLILPTVLPDLLRRLLRVLEVDV